jgi:hypothetical protein
MGDLVSFYTVPGAGLKEYEFSQSPIRIRSVIQEVFVSMLIGRNWYLIKT